MLFTIFVLFAVCWLLFRTIGLALHLTWCAAKVAAVVLFALALPALVICLVVAGGVLLIIPLALAGAAFAVLKACA